MKQILSLMKPHVIRAMLYSCVSKIVISLCVILLWNRYINEGSFDVHSIVGTGFFAIFVWFLIAAWLQYLSLDGMKTLQFSRKKEKVNASEKHFRLADFFGNKNRLIVAMDDEELDDDEAMAAKLCSNLLIALLFLISNLLFTYWPF